MSEPFSLAVNALASAPLSRAAEARPLSAEAPAGASFSEMLSGLAQEGVRSLHAAEKVATQGLSGNAGVQEVVSSMLAAERALQTAIAVRDKTISAIQEIGRMQI